MESNSQNSGAHQEIIKLEDEKIFDKIVISSSETAEEFKTPIPKVTVKKSEDTNAKGNEIPKRKTEIEGVEYGKKSHLEFLKKMKDNKDPINVEGRGGLQYFTMEEIKKHNNEKSLWTVINGNVYDLTMYLDYHPGGAKKLLQGAGKDGTSLFNKYHSWVNYQLLVGKLQIGYLTK